jgi:hypothetical protein
MVNRRTVLLAGGGMVLAGTGLAGIASAASPSTSANGFRRCLEQVFGVSGTASGTVDVTLAAVRDVPSTTARQEQFSLLFRGPAAQPIDPSSYTVEHYASGRRYEMYLDAAGSANGAPLYRADFNLIRR